jgi:hypothetical protein
MTLALGTHVHMYTTTLHTSISTTLKISQPSSTPSVPQKQTRIYHSLSCRQLPPVRSLPPNVDVISTKVLTTKHVHALPTHLWHLKHVKPRSALALSFGCSLQLNMGPIALTLQTFNLTFTRTTWIIAHAMSICQVRLHAQNIRNQATIHPSACLLTPRQSSWANASTAALTIHHYQNKAVLASHSPKVGILACVWLAQLSEKTSKGHAYQR